jgi:hypothetical protein
MHLLIKDVPTDDAASLEEEKAWVRTAFLVRWRRTPRRYNHSDPSQTITWSENYDVTMICFGAVKHFRERCMRLRLANGWEDILGNPYTLIGYYLESWYERVDRVVWSANRRGSRMETVRFPGPDIELQC